MSKKTKKSKLVSGGDSIKITFKDNHYRLSTGHGYDISDSISDETRKSWEKLSKDYDKMQQDMEVLYKESQQRHYDSIK